MSNNKRMLCLLAAILCLSLTACGKAKGETPPQSSPEPETYTPVPTLDAQGSAAPVTDGTAPGEESPEATPTAPAEPVTVVLRYDGAPVTALSFQTSTVFELTAVTSNGASGGSWTSSDASSASVDENGIVTCWKAGTPKITYTLGDASASVTVTVTEPTVVITFGGAVKSDITLNGVWGFEIDLNAIVTPEGSQVTWISDDASVATVTNAGHVRGLKMGTTTVRAQCGTAEAACIIRITENPPYYAPPTPDVNDGTPRIVIVFWGVPKDDFTLAVGTSVQMNYMLYNMDPNSAVTWTIADPEYASVDAHGIVKGLRPTKEKDALHPYTTLIASCGDVRCECIVRVKEADKP